MNTRLVATVFASALDLWLKPYAAAFASFAAEDGSRVFPSVARVARMLNRSPRQVHRAIAELREKAILVPESTPTRHLAIRYRFQAEKLPRTTDGRQLVIGFPQANARKRSA